MNIKSREKIAEVIDSVIREENDARENELKSARDKVTELNNTIKQLKKDVRNNEGYKYLLSRLEKLTCVYVCPNCAGAGGWDDGEGNGGECDTCCGSGFINHGSLLKREHEHAPQVQDTTVVSKQDDEQLPF